nr:glycosyltransferase [Verrucomicrobium spinosum]
MIHGKGLTTLVDAFIELDRRGRVPGVKLRIAGAKTPADDKYIEGLQSKLASAGLAERVTWEPNVSFEEKTRFLHEVTVFSVPATYGEASVCMLWKPRRPVCLSCSQGTGHSRSCWKSPWVASCVIQMM